MKRWTSLFFAFIFILISAFLVPHTSYAATGTTTPNTDTSVTLPTAELVKYAPLDIKNEWGKATLQNMLYSNLIKGYANQDGTYSFKPNQPITRAEFVTLLIRVLGLPSKTGSMPFTDVKSIQWYYSALDTAYQNHLINGLTPTKFAPEANVTRGQIAALLVRAFKNRIDFSGESQSFTDVSGNWALKDIDEINKVGIINGYPDGTYRPGHSATREEAAVILDRAMNKEQINLPSDADVIAPLQNVFSNYQKDLNSKTFTTSANQSLLSNEYGFGKLALEILIKPIFSDTTGSNQTLDYTFTMPTFKVVSESEQLATVEVTNTLFDMKGPVSSTGNQDEVSYDLNGTYRLIKNNGVWKIYYGFKPNILKIVNSGN